MLLLMDSKSESSLTSFSGDESLQSVSPGAGSDSARKHKRRENNRVAAQRSRKKQTERADALHKELETLEHANAAYEKEIALLRQEIQLYNSALQQHEPQCLLPVSQPENSLCGPVPAPAAAPNPGPVLGPAFQEPLSLDLADPDFGLYFLQGSGNLPSMSMF
ncbi:basic leucine zipper transcriptional factor ATF-like 2 [Arapaima gigas]